MLKLWQNIRDSLLIGEIHIIFFFAIHILCWESRFEIAGSEFRINGIEDFFLVN